MTANMEAGTVRRSGFTPPCGCAIGTCRRSSRMQPLGAGRRLILRNDTLELPDGDFLRLEWLDADGPLVVMLHGLEGSSRSPYARGVIAALGRAGYRVVLMTFRGCGGYPTAWHGAITQATPTTSPASWIT